MHLSILSSPCFATSTSLVRNMAVTQGYCAQVSDTEVIAQLMAKNQTVVSILSSRQATLQLVKSFWARGDVRGALAALLQSSGDASVCVACWNHSRHSQSMSVLFMEEACTADPFPTGLHITAQVTPVAATACLMPDLALLLEYCCQVSMQTISKQLQPASAYQ